MSTTVKAVAIAGGACIGLGFSIAGYLIAGIPGQIVGFLLAMPLCLAFGIYTGKNL